jgi:hypothetical protein
LKAAAELTDAFTKLTKAGMGIASAIGKAVAPILKRNADDLLRYAVAAKKWIGDHEGLIQTALKVGTVLATTGAAILGFGIALSGIGSAIGGLRTGYGLLLSFVNISWAPMFASLAGGLKTVAFARFASEGVSSFSVIGGALTAFSAKLANSGGIMNMVAHAIIGGMEAATTGVVRGFGMIVSTVQAIPGIISAAFTAAGVAILKFPVLLEAVSIAFGAIGTAAGAAAAAIVTAFGAGGVTGVLAMFAAKIGAVFIAIGTFIAGITLPISVTSWKTRTTPDTWPVSVRIGAALSSIGTSRPSLVTSAVWLANATVWPSRKTRATMSSAGWCVSSLTILKTFWTGCPTASASFHPASVIATGFKKRTFPSASVVSTASPMLVSVTRKRCSLSRKAASVSRRAASARS